MNWLWIDENLPDISKNPITIRNIPATLLITVIALLHFPKAVNALPTKSEVIRNERPKPIEKITNRKVPSKTVPDVEARSKIEPRSGPTQGDQPRAKIVPNKKELAKDTRWNKRGTAICF